MNNLNMEQKKIRNKLKDSCKVHFIGAGPGNPDLITRRGWRALNNSNIILYDALLDFNGFHSAAPNSRWIDVGKRANRISIKQSFIGKMLVNYSLRGFSVARLKGGDPSIFGRISEELLALKVMQIPYEIIPGVTAASSAAASLGISLTKRHQSRSVSFVTASVGDNSTKENKWFETVLHSDTSIIYMSGRDRKKIANTLITKGMNPSCPVAIVESAGTNTGYKKIMPLSELADGKFFKIDGPVCLIIGEITSGSNLLEQQEMTKLSPSSINGFAKIKKICHEK